MKYLPRPADIGFMCHTKDWDSKLIAGFMRSRWSHSFLIDEVGKHITFTSETSAYQVTAGYLERYLQDPKVRMEIWRLPGLDPNVTEDICKAAHENYGIVYGYAQLLGFAVVCSLERVGIDIDQFVKHNLVCNQHVMDSYRRGSGIFSSIAPKTIHTEEFYKHIKKCGFEKVFEQEEAE